MPKKYFKTLVVWKAESFYLIKAKVIVIIMFTVSLPNYWPRRRSIEPDFGWIQSNTKAFPEGLVSFLYGSICIS